MMTERLMSDSIELIKRQEKDNLLQLPEAKKAWSIINRYVNKKYAVYEQAMSSPHVQETLIDAYIEAFSKKELDEILDFFETNAGKQYLFSIQELSEIPMRTINKEIMKRMPEIIEITHEFQRDLELSTLE